jgi:hypothetical protein
MGAASTQGILSQPANVRKSFSSLDMPTRNAAVSKWLNKLSF